MARPKPVESIVVYGFCRKLAVNKAFDRCPEDLDNSNPPEVPLSSWN